jgi:DNA-binding transcriptional ArsR family regulator
MKQRNATTEPTCKDGDHTPVPRPAADPAAIDRAARLFRAMGDGPRLRLLDHLSHGECCVTELVSALGEKFSTVSQRLRILRTEGLVVRRRVGTHVFYALADTHVARLVANALAHAGELEGSDSHSHDSED